MNMDRCHILVDINGEEVFLVDKKFLCSSAKLTELLLKTAKTLTTATPKVSLIGLPGGPPVFELIVRYYYNHGRIPITPTSACLLGCATHFMEIVEDDSSSADLVKQIKSCLKGIPSWSCSELLTALKQCNDNLPSATSSSVFDKVLDALVTRISSETAAATFPPECSGFRVSSDAQSIASSKSTFSGSLKVWWLDDLVAFGADAVEKIARSMLSHKLDHGFISRFLFYYLKSKCSRGTPDERKRIIEQVVDLAYSLDKASVPCKCLFEILRMSSPLNLRTSIRKRIEVMIGCQIDQATPDNILVPASNAMGSLYDVDLVLRLLRYFLDNGGFSHSSQLKKVGSLMDLYLVEIAPDPGLKPHKFILLAMALPDRARDCYDGMYRAIDMYLQIHSDLSEEQKTKICCVLNYEKLSSKTCKHLMQNPNMPSRTAVQAVASQQSKLRALLQDTNNLHNPPRNSLSDEEEQVVLYAKKLGVSRENKMLRDHLEGMQWKIVELENVCKTMQSHISNSKAVKTGVPSKRLWWPLPRLCS